MPKLVAHLVKLAIDLPALFFLWFLSLFTDCLPIEVRMRMRNPCVCMGTHGVLTFVVVWQMLFCMWDVLLLNGLSVLFRMDRIIVVTYIHKVLVQLYSESIIKLFF
jgi:hypothetical protein